MAHRPSSRHRGSRAPRTSGTSGDGAARSRPVPGVAAPAAGPALARRRLRHRRADRRDPRPRRPALASSASIRRRASSTYAAASARRPAGHVPPADAGAAARRRAGSTSWCRAWCSTSCPTRARRSPRCARVAAPGGVVAAYVWDYAERHGAHALVLGRRRRPRPGRGRPRRGRALPDLPARGPRGAVRGAGLVDVEAGAIEVPTRFADFDDYWAPFLGGQGVAPAYAMALAAPARDRLRERLRELRADRARRVDRPRGACVDGARRRRQLGTRTAPADWCPPGPSCAWCRGLRHGLRVALGQLPVRAARSGRCSRPG